MPGFTRRRLLAAGAAATFMPRAALAGADAPSGMAPAPGAPGTPETVLLEARPGMAQLVAGDAPETPIWGYDGKVPGPLVRAPQGARIRRRLVNGLPQSTALHWHGLRIDNAMDGVPGLTQEAVAPGGSFDYDFTLPDAGSFWYHSHDHSTEQVARGLYGVLIVDEPEPPEADHDIALVIDDWRFTDTATIADDFDDAHDWSHAGRLGNYITARLLPETESVSQNQRLRLRLINTATDRIMVLRLNGLDGWVVALDGMPLAAPEPLVEILLAPAQRVDLLVDVVAEPGDAARLVLVDRGQAYILHELPVKGRAALVRRGLPAPLPANPIPALGDVAGFRRQELRMTGGAMGGLGQAIYQGRRMSEPDLIELGQIWAFNGVIGLPEAPLASIGAGEGLRIPIVNDTVFPHAMHLHGTHFREVRADGSLGPWRDTIYIAPSRTREIALSGENPGDWLFHCHMLSHQKAGMKTWITVAA